MAARKKPAPKRGASRYQAPAKKPVPGWIWLACGLVVGGFFMFLFSLEPGRDEIKRDKGEQVRSTKPEPKPTQPEPARPKYDFYTLLPESEVILPQALEETPPPVPEQKPVTPEEAAKIDTARAEAALNGQVPPPAPPVLAS
ncbi:MAG: cell division protein, partial [Ectopseudomonas oleovorans]